MSCVTALPQEESRQEEYRIDFRSLRKKAGLTLKECATALGASLTVVGYWNQGRQPHVKYLPPMAALFGCTIEELYGLPRP